MLLGTCWTQVKAWVDNLLQRGLIEPSTSAYGSPILLLNKHKVRMVVDYRALNKVTLKNRHPLPRVDHLYNCMVPNTFPAWMWLLGFSNCWDLPGQVPLLELTHAPKPLFELSGMKCSILRTSDGKLDALILSDFVLVHWQFTELGHWWCADQKCWGTHQTPDCISAAPQGTTAKKPSNMFVAKRNCPTLG